MFERGREGEKRRRGGGGGARRGGEGGEGEASFLVELGKDGMEMEVYLLFVHIHVESGAYIYKSGVTPCGIQGFLSFFFFALILQCSRVQLVSYVYTYVDIRMFTLLYVHVFILFD